MWPYKPVRPEIQQLCKEMLENPNDWEGGDLENPFRTSFIHKTSKLTISVSTLDKELTNFANGTYLRIKEALLLHESVELTKIKQALKLIKGV